MAIKRTKLLLSLPILVVGAFFVYTYNRPWFMIWDDACSESPIGFYRMQIVSYEYVDYNDGSYQTYAPTGGLWEFTKYYFGQFDPCVY